MLKGHVFKEQIFGNQIFALFINTFLNGKNGVSNNYKNGMEITYSGSVLTVQSGAVCIQGRFLEEDTSTDVAAGTDTAYCKLVIEVDLDKQNTESNFVQAIYKIVKSTTGYPELTQTEVVKNNSGIYQYELARFQTNSNGITDFQDMRTFLDFESIYTALQTEYRSVLEELRQELANVEDESAFVMKNNIVTIYGTIEMPESDNENISGITYLNYPSGFNNKNCVVISVMGQNTDMHSDWWGTPISSKLLNSIMVGTGDLNVNLQPENIRVMAFKYTNEQNGFRLSFKVTLMKIDSDVSDYELGDVNMDGEVNQSDLTLLQNFIQGTGTLTDKQFKLADMNNDGVLNTGDTFLLSQKINGNS